MTIVNVEATREIASRAGNLFLPLYDEDGTNKLFATNSTDERTNLDSVFQETAQLWSRDNDDPAVLDVFRQFCRLLPKLGLVKALHDPADADFHWSRIRCVLAGAGHLAHIELSQALVSLYPQCPLRADETPDQWMEAAKTAHRVCGWPIGLGLVEWQAIASSTDAVEKEKDRPVFPWMRVVALFHVLKHVRLSRRYGLVVTYRNTAACFEPDEFSNLIGASERVARSLMTALGARSSPNPKTVYPLTVALRGWIQTLNTGDILERRALSQLPGRVQAGPWSNVSPDPLAVSGFIQHGLRLSGVWLALDGRISPETGDTAAIVSYDWSLSGVGSDDERRRFEAGLPQRYDASRSPYEILKFGFPNLRHDHFGSEKAAACLFDALVCGSLLRLDVPALDSEKPLVLCMPTTPTLDESTNQGKSKCAHAIARALCPGIPLTGVSDTESAPDQRAIASTIERHGTLCADEWVQPKRKGHILNHEKLQMLITGGSVAAGKAYENSPAALRLAFPMVVSCKAIDAPPDIVNRSLLLLLDRLNDEQRQRAEVLDDIESGKLSLTMRLAGIAMIETMGLAAKLAKARKVSSVRGWRFNSLRTLSALIFQERHGGRIEDAYTVLDDAIADMQLAFQAHTREAETSGLLGVLEEGTAVKVRLHALFVDKTSRDLEQMVAFARAHADDPRGMSPTTMLRAAANVMDLGHAPLSRLMEHLAGQRARVSDRTMAQALSREIRALMPIEGSEWIMPDALGLSGWRLVRGADNHGAPRITIVQKAPPGVALI